MASYSGENKTISEYMAEHKYMKPSSVYCGNKRVNLEVKYE